jgi:hypothetical protein
MLATRSLLGLIGTLAVVAVLWLTLLSGSDDRVPAVNPGATTAPAGATGGATPASGYNRAIDAARGAAQQAYQDAERGAGSAAGTP